MGNERRFIENEVSEWEKKVKCYINTVNNYSRRECPNKVDPSTAPVEKRVSPTPEPEEPARIYNRRPSVSYEKSHRKRHSPPASDQTGLLGERGGGEKADTRSVVVVVATIHI